MILKAAYGSYTSKGHFSYYLGTFGAFLTAFYSTRLLYLTFLTNPNGYKLIICKAYDSSIQICFALGVLTIPSIFAGYYFKDMIIGLGTDFWGNAIIVLPENMNAIDSEFIRYSFKILSVLLSLIGTFPAFLLLQFCKSFSFSTKNLNFW